jgi:hypothetical protein
MKPWFVKEADIIKFPEPEKKVVELPNVQSYPDFLTGVKDLHNRKDRGEISQASHDKLYSDLINRFMKKESFDTPWYLREAEAEKLVNGSNKGTYLETLLAAAVTARLTKGSDIGPGDVKKKMTDMDDNLTATYKVKGNDKIPDMVIFQTLLKARSDSYEDLLEPKNLDVMAPYVENSAKVANESRVLGKIEDKIFNNKQKDKLYVQASGATEQKGSKVDVRLKSVGEDGKETYYKKISLKLAKKSQGKIKLDNKDINSIEETAKWFEEFLKIDIYTDGLKKKVWKSFDKRASANQMEKIMEFAAKKLQNMLQGDNNPKEKQFIDNFKHFIDKSMSHSDPDVVLIEVTKEDFTLMDFKTFETHLPDYNLAVKYTFKKRPYIIIMAKKRGTEKWEILAHIRYTFMAPNPESKTPSRREEGRHRFMVTAEDLFRELSNVKNVQQTEPTDTDTQTQPKTTPTTPGAKPQTAPQQKVATGNDGQRYTHYGLQWINQETGRIATRDVAAYLDQNTHLQTPVSA